MRNHSRRSRAHYGLSWRAGQLSLIRRARAQRRQHSMPSTALRRLPKSWRRVRGGWMSAERSFCAAGRLQKGRRGSLRCVRPA